MAKGRKQLNILISQKIMIYEDIELTPFVSQEEEGEETEKTEKTEETEETEGETPKE